MRVVVILALAALAALIVALFTGSTWPAFLVIVLAVAGIVLLLRDWRSERANEQSTEPGADFALSPDPLHPDEFAPDISTEPGGPSSDARSDQIEGS